MPHRPFMERALDAGWRFQGLTYPNPAVGCVVVIDGGIVGSGAHKKAGFAHAEVHAICDAIVTLCPEKSPFFEGVVDPYILHRLARTHGENLFSQAILYVTLEPCAHEGKTPACSSLIGDLGFSLVVIGSYDPTPQASGGIAILQARGVDVEVGVMKKECDLLLTPFLLWQNKSFWFFKMALTLNGVVTGGTLSSLVSRRHMHSLRSVIERLVIGGNTVRIDRPTLDARLCDEGKAPHVTILSHADTFDRSIPLFEIPHREVSICDDLSSIGGKCVMVEGGEGLLSIMKEREEMWYLFYLTPQFRCEASLFLSHCFEFCYTYPMGEDILIWARNKSS